MSENQENFDAFANIAAQRVTYRDRNLTTPEPLSLPQKDLPLTTNGKGIKFPRKERIANESELEAELQKMRQQYQPFMKNHAPSIPKTRVKQPLVDFDWRIQTEADQKNFPDVLHGKGEWESIQVPHFGAPVGKAATYYRTLFNVTEQEINTGAAFICFKGVDYKAHVFINETYVGSHEGFFAPFEFDFTEVARSGENTLLVKVENDYICASNGAWGDPHSGDKIYAATNLGFDDPELGWHHCPPGMGIYQDVFIEFRQRTFISDIYTRPLPESSKAELWIEAYSCDIEAKEIAFDISIFGRNFPCKVIENFKFFPESIHECGQGDEYQIAMAKASGIYQKPVPLKLSRGPNQYRVTIDMGDFKWWSPDSPWLYQAQIRICDKSGSIFDAQERHFGMRSFTMDTESTPKGALELNGNPIRLRGANTMGHEQQCVFKKEWNQLRDDILLAKICNMNFLRITQRPVQPEVYDYCDMLGLMTQCDLPTFAVIRRNQYCEALRQTGEMERLVRSHPCNIIVSYINEPVSNSDNEPHRQLNRKELEDFFQAADGIVKHLNPERVTKACDGDYDPPAPGIQDRHCYCSWYNGQGVDIGKLHKGYWQPTKKDWYYGCGEFGAEGLEVVDLMRRRYPSHWLPAANECEKDWSPSSIVRAQTGKFHYFFFETPESLEEWVETSQQYQAEALRMMTEAFRRNNDMVTFAVHLFIDAFPSGWMKTIMDCERRPKKAYFAYRDTLEPLLPNLRTDRSRYFSGETIEIEAWICNDLSNSDTALELRYQFVSDGSVLASGTSPAEIVSNAAQFQGFLKTTAPECESRKTIQVELSLVNTEGEAINDTRIELEVFPKIISSGTAEISVLGTPSKSITSLMEELKLSHTETAEVIVTDSYENLQHDQETVLNRVKKGARLVVLNLAPGNYEFATHHVQVKPSGFNDLHFVSRRSNHSMVQGFKPHDFKHWFKASEDCICPIIESTFTAEHANPILLSGNTDATGEWDKALAAAEFNHGNGSIVICQVKLAGFVETNPPAMLFAHRLISKN